MEGNDKMFLTPKNWNSGPRTEDSIAQAERIPVFVAVVKVSVFCQPAVATATTFL